MNIAVCLLALCVLVALLPPRWDPAIRIKEWQIRRGKHPEARNKEE